MKILRIIARLNVGGPARHVTWLTKELQDEEFESLLVAGTVPPGEENMEYFAEQHGVAPYFLPEMSRELSRRDITSLYKLYRKIKNERPDIIHTHTAKAGTVGRVAGFLYRWLTWSSLLGRPRRVRIVHTFHGHVFHSYYGKLKTRIFLTIERLLGRFATDRIVVISSQQKQEINSHFRVGREGQFAVIPLGIDLDIFSGRSEDRDIFRAEVGVAEDAVAVGFIGRLTEIKNIPLLLQAAKLCGESSQESTDLKFVIIGDGHLREKLEGEAGSLGLEDSVVFVGNRNDPERFYAGLDIVALTSLNEGTPLSLIEGMAAGCPVIATGVGGVVDLLGEVTEAGDGFLICERGIRIDSRSAADLSRGLIYLAKNEKLRASFKARGRAFVEEQYGKDRLVNDMKELYRSLVRK